MTLGGDLERLLEADAVLERSGARPFHLPIGELASVVAGTVLGLERGDWWVPGLRERAGAVLRQVPVERLVDGFAGARPYKVAPPVAAPALRALHAVGLAMSARDRAVAVHLGVGSVADGAFYEALNLAALQGVRVVFVVAQRTLEGAPVPAQSAAPAAKIALAMGIRTAEVDGTSIAEVRDAVAEARRQDGPTVMVARLD